MFYDTIFSNPTQDYLLRVLEAGAGQGVEHVPDVPPAGALQLLHQPHRQRPVHRVHVRDVVRPLRVLVLLGSCSLLSPHLLVHVVHDDAEPLAEDGVLRPPAGPGVGGQQPRPGQPLQARQQLVAAGLQQQPPAAVTLLTIYQSSCTDLYASNTRGLRPPHTTDWRQTTLSTLVRGTAPPSTRSSTSSR